MAKGKPAQYTVTAKITMRSGRLSKAAAEKLKQDTKRKAPNAVVTMKKV